MMMRKRMLVFGVALATWIVGAPSWADEIEAEEVIVGEEIVAPPAEPCPECDVNNGDVTFNFGNDFTNAYFFRGILQEKNGFIWQPWGDVNFTLWDGGETVVSGITLTLGTWNSVHTKQTNSSADGSGPGNWYQSNVIARLGGVMDYGLGAGVAYIARVSPNDAFGSIQEIDIDLQYDDSQLYGGPLADMGFALAPYAIFAFEFDKTAFGPDEGIYMELGASPSVEVGTGSDYPITVSVPMILGTSLDNYYLPNPAPDGSSPGDDFFGYAQVGLGFSVPLAFVPARLGKLTAGVQGNWLALGSNLQRFNNGPRNGQPGTNPSEGQFGEWIGVASLNWSY